MRLSSPASVVGNFFQGVAWNDPAQIGGGWVDSQEGKGEEEHLSTTKTPCLQAGSCPQTIDCQPLDYANF